MRFVFTPPADHAAGLLTLPWPVPLADWRDDRLVEIRQRGIQPIDGLLDALVELLVRLHLSGFFWGDCSLSNTLFRHTRARWRRTWSTRRPASGTLAERRAADLGRRPGHRTGRGRTARPAGG